MTFENTKKWRWLGVLGAVFVPAIVVASVNVPFTFTSGTPIRASEMNANIQALKTAIDGEGAVAPAAMGTLTLAGFSETLSVRRFGHNLAIVVDTSSGSGIGRAQVDDIEVSFALGNTSPQLNQLVNQGQHLQQANLAFGNLLIRLENVQITGLTVDGIVDGVPLQKARIGFSLIEWTWQPAGQPSRTVFYNRSTNQGGGGGGTTPRYAYFGPGVTPDPNFIGITGYFSEQLNGGSGSTGGSTGRTEHSPLRMTKTAIGAHLLDDLGLVTRGAHVQTAEVQWQRAGTGGVMQIQHELDMEDVQVTEVKMSTAPNGDLTESLGLTYSRIRWTVGSSMAGWDVAGNRPF